MHKARVGRIDSVGTKDVWLRISDSSPQGPFEPGSLIQPGTCLCLCADPVPVTTHFRVFVTLREI
jgi:hypothetical protein